VVPSYCARVARLLLRPGRIKRADDLAIRVAWPDHLRGAAVTAAVLQVLDHAPIAGYRVISALGDGKS